MRCLTASKHLPVRWVGIGVALALLGGSLVACSKDHHEERSGVVTATVHPDLGQTGPVTWDAAQRSVHGDEGKDVKLSLSRDSTALVTASDTQHRQRGLGLAIEVPGLANAPVTVDYRSTAVSELLLTPHFITANPLAALLVEHAAFSSPHLAGLADQLRQHAAKDPAYLQHPTQAEVTGLAQVGTDVDAWLARTTAKINTAHPSPAARPPLGLHTAAPARCSVLRPYVAVKTGICYTAPHGTGGNGEVTLHASSGSPSWAMFFSSARSDLPLGVVPAAVYKQPSGEDLANGLLNALSKIGKQAICQGARETFGRECEEDEWAQLEDAMDPPKQGTADIHVPAELTGSPMYEIEAGGAGNGDTTKVPVGSGGVEVWKDVAVALTLWSQFVSPLKSIVDGVTSERTDTVPNASSAKWKALATAVAGPIKPKLTQFANDLIAGDSEAVTQDAVNVSEAMLEDPNVVKAFLGLWDVKIDELAIGQLERWIERYTGPVGARIKLILELAEDEGPVTSAGVGLYRLDVELDSYPTFASFQPLHPGQAPKPPDVGGGGDLGGHVGAPGAGRWASPAWSLKIDRSGGVVINWRTGTWCEYTKQQPCDRKKGNLIIPGGEAEGQLESGSGNGQITFTTDPHGVAEGPVTIERKGKNIVRLLVTVKDSPPVDLVVHQGAGPLYPVTGTP